MNLSRIKLRTDKDNYTCECCGAIKRYSQSYTLYPHPSVVKLLVDQSSRVVCIDCAMREEFGSKYKQSKKYKEFKDAK